MKMTKYYLFIVLILFCPFEPFNQQIDIRKFRPIYEANKPCESVQKVNLDYDKFHLISSQGKVLSKLNTILAIFQSKNMFSFFVNAKINFENEEDDFDDNDNNIGDLEIDLIKKKENEALNRGTILLACSILGKFSQENKKTMKKINSKIKKFSFDYEYDDAQAFSIVNLLLLRHCRNSLTLDVAVRLISSQELPERSHMKHLNIVSVITNFEQTVNKDALFDELDGLNDELKNLNTKLDELRKNKVEREREEKRIEEKNKKKKIEREKRKDQNKKRDGSGNIKTGGKKQDKEGEIFDFDDDDFDKTRKSGKFANDIYGNEAREIIYVFFGRIKNFFMWVGSIMISLISFPFVTLSIELILSAILFIIITIANLVWRKAKNKKKVTNKGLQRNNSKNEIINDSEINKNEAITEIVR